MIEPLGYPDSLLSVSVSLVEHTAFGEGAREVGLSHDCGEHYEAEPLTGRLVVYHVHQFPAGMFGPAIVAREIERSGEVILSRDLERGVAETLCDRLNPFRRSAHLRDVTARVHVMAAHIGRHPSESSRVVKRFGELFGLPEIPPDYHEFIERKERLAKIKTKIDRTLDILSRFGQWAQRHRTVWPFHRRASGLQAPASLEYGATA